MSETYRVVLADAALRDLTRIASYIRKHSPQNAEGVAEKILDGVDALAAMPSRFKVVGKSKKRGTAVHALVVRPFIIYYRVQKSPAAVYVFHVRHGSRRQPRHFE